MWTPEKFQILHSTIANISYKKWSLRIILDKQNHTPPYAVCIMAGFQDCTGKEWTTRKWLISPHMTVSEIVQTAFLMIKTAEEHEMREEFRYKGQTIFGPHFNVERLVNLASEGEKAIDIRK